MTTIEGFLRTIVEYIAHTKDKTMGSPADAAATSSTTNPTVVALLKGILVNLEAINTNTA